MFPSFNGSFPDEIMKTCSLAVQLSVFLIQLIWVYAIGILSKINTLNPNKINSNIIRLSYWYNRGQLSKSWTNWVKKEKKNVVYMENFIDQNTNITTQPINCYSPVHYIHAISTGRSTQYDYSKSQSVCDTNNASWSLSSRHQVDWIQHIPLHLR